MRREAVLPHDTERCGGPELVRISQHFVDARGITADAEWAESALVRLVFDDVRIDLAEQLLAEAARTVAETQESPEELFSEPSQWAQEQISELNDAGVDAFEDPLLLGFRETVLSTFGGACAVALLFIVSDLVFWPLSVQPIPLNAATGLTPLPMSVLLFALITVYKHGERRLPFPVLAAGCAGILILGATAISLMIQELNALQWEAHWAWRLLVPVAYAALWWVLRAVWPARHQKQHDFTVEAGMQAARLPDEQWLDQLQQELRARGDLPPRRISSILSETRVHADDSALPLVEEFGSAKGYAQQLTGDAAIRLRRLTLLYSAAAAGWLGLGLSHLSSNGWQLLEFRPLLHVALVALSLFTAGMHARQWRRAAVANAADAPLHL